MQLQNIQQQIAECVEVYYEPLLKRTLMEHKKATIICEESGPISLSQNILLTTSKTNRIAKHVVPIATTKPSVQPIIINEMVELPTNQSIVEDEVNIESQNYHFEDEMQF